MSLLEQLYAELDYAVFQKVDGSRFQCVTQPPAWFRYFQPEVSKDDIVDIAEFSPFLENFLVDSELHWESGAKVPSKSGPWIETDDQSLELSLEATAVSVGTESIIILNSLGMEYEQQLQKLQIARENLLTQEDLEMQVRLRTADIRVREEEIAIRLIAAAGHRDEETGAHIRRIGLYAEELTRVLDWDPSRIDDIKLAAPMHDVGKIGISDLILHKPGKLTEAEYEKMKEHAIIGEKMLSGSGIPMLDLAAEIAGGHHEKWDGTGYPRGLKGEEIPQSARIVSMLDVYDALVHRRVYKNAFSEDETLKTMTELVGTQFDPELFEVFKHTLSRIREIKDQNPDDHHSE